MRWFLCLLALTAWCDILAQADTYVISGTLSDSAGVTLPGATVLISQLPEKNLAGFAFSNDSGSFRVEVDTLGRYEVKVTYIGYGTFVREVEIDRPGERALGDITLSTNVEQLQGVTIEARFRPIVVKNDTIEYDADSFNAGEGATVEDLLKNLPGVTVEEDGTVKAQGEEVEKVLVDGKEFFEKDPKVATRNIPADVVDKVQVYDDPSDFTKFTGIQDGEEEKTINLAIKEGKNKGTFGRLKAEYGIDDRYSMGGSINRFNDRMQLSLLGNMNNTSEQSFSIEDFLQFSGGLDGMMSAEIDGSELPMNLLRQRGITRSESGGVNFNYSLSKKTELSSNYFYARSDNRTKSIGNTGSFLTNGRFVSDSEADERNLFTDHRIKLNLEHTFNKKKVLTLRLGGGMSEPQIMSDAKLTSTVGDSIVNGSDTRSDVRTAIDRWNGQLVYRSKFNKPGRFFTTDLKVNGRSRKGSGTLFSLLGTDMQDTIDQRHTRVGDELGYSVFVNYVEPIGSSHYLYLKVGREQNTQENTKLFYALQDEGDDLFLPGLSNGFDRTLYRHVWGLKYQQTKRKWVASLGADLQQTELDNQDQFSSNTIGSTYWNLLPNALINWKRTSASSLEMRYHTRIQVPDIQQLQPVLDNSDPLKLYQGDPDLDPEYVHSVNLRYHNFNEFYFRSFFAGVQGRLVGDAIAERVAIDEQLVTQRSPVNSAAEWELLGFYEFSSPLPETNLKYRVNGEYATERYNVLINELADRLAMNRIDQRIRMENRKKKVWDWEVGTRGRFRLMRYEQSTAFDQDLVNIDVFCRARAKFLKHWEVKMKAKRRLYLENDFIGATELNFVDLELSRSFWDKALTLYVRGVNLLDETAAVRRDAYGNSYGELITDRLGRMVLFGVSYRIRKFGE